MAAKIVVQVLLKPWVHWLSLKQQRNRKPIIISQDSEALENRPVAKVTSSSLKLNDVICDIWYYQNIFKNP